MALYAREREREAESESLVFERQFVKELSDTAGDVIKQLHTTSSQPSASLTVRQITVNRPLTQYTHAQTHTHTHTHTHIIKYTRHAYYYYYYYYYYLLYLVYQIQTRQS